MVICGFFVFLVGVCKEVGGIGVVVGIFFVGFVFVVVIGGGGDVDKLLILLLFFLY